MNFGFTEEQDLLRAELRKFLDQNASLEQVRKQVESPEGFSRPLWTRMAELGWVGLTIPETYGGVGMDFVTLVVVLEETGRTLFPSPLVSTVLAAKAIEKLGSAEQRQRWLPGLADGSRIGTLAVLEASDRLDPEGIELRGQPQGDGFVLTGEKRFVSDAGKADLFVVAFRTGDGAEDVGLAVVERDTSGVSADDQPSMDLTKRVGRLLLDGAAVDAGAILGEPGVAWPTLAWLLDVGAALVAAEMVGAGEGALRITTDFAKERVQFDALIGRFQGVKHPLAEMYVDIESYKSLVYYAAWALDQDSDDAPLAVSRAKAYASEALPRIGIDGVQLHGGVGYTWEYDIQLYLKRSKWARPAFGDADYHYERLAALGGL
ncbi:MAG: acyl-CoA/acyl-ACP dehydrogenase [Proteobacteria bacterium]|nr:acyl-CoA/acyl-ACP dehydrogenase [Pseudomonadota bacterium]